MLAYSSTKTIQSKVHPGVSFTIRVMSEAFRTQVFLGLIEIMAKIRHYQVELTRYQGELPKDAEDQVDLIKAVGTSALVEIQNLNDKIMLLKKEQVHPTYAHAGFVKAQGISIDGNESPDMNMIRDRGSEAFYNEIVEAIKDEVELTDEQRANLELPTSSGALEPEAKTSMTALSVDPTDSSSNEIVDVSIPRM